MKIYIAGKVSGEPIAECTMKFGAAQKEIEAKGHEAVNPLAVVNDWKATWETAMRKCLKTLMDCDAIYLLDDFIDSPGARFEKEIALRLGMPIYHEYKRDFK